MLRLQLTLRRCSRLFLIQNAPDNRAEPHEFAQARWFSKMNHGPSACCPVFEDGRIEGRHHDDGRFRVLPGAAQALEDIVAVTLRKMHVQYYQVERRGFRIGVTAGYPLDRLLPVA